MGNNDYPVIEADVLIIGGGSAGIMAAIRAKEVNPDQNVVIFAKVPSFARNFLAHRSIYLYNNSKQAF